jgi:hypothetical protein
MEVQPKVADGNAPPERGKVQKKIRRSLVVLYRELTFQEEFVPWRQSKWFRFCTHMRSPSPPLIARELGNDVVVRFFFFSNLFFSPSSSLLWFILLPFVKCFMPLGFGSKAVKGWLGFYLGLILTLIKSQKR